MFLFFVQIIEEFHDLPARFGAAFPINGLRALAIQSNPSNACTLIDSPPRNNTYHPIQKWVVIITRWELLKNTNNPLYSRLKMNFAISGVAVLLKWKCEMHRKPVSMQPLCTMLIAMNSVSYDILIFYWGRFRFELSSIMDLVKPYVILTLVTCHCVGGKVTCDTQNE